MQALGVALYVTFFVLAIQSVSPAGVNLGPVTGPIFALLAFSASALICGSIVFMHPVLLFFADRKKEAVDIVIWTAVWLFSILLVYGCWLLYSRPI